MMKSFRRQQSAFTLLELMMVVGIIGLVVAMGVPAILSVMHAEPLRDTVNSVKDIFFDARAEAIHDNKMTAVAIYPPLDKIELVGGVDTSVAMTKLGVSAATSIQIDHSVSIYELDICLTDSTHKDVAFVRFFPNGTCDESMLTLVDAGNQYRTITLDPTTALASVGLPK